MFTEQKKNSEYEYVIVFIGTARQIKWQYSHLILIPSGEYFGNLTS